MDRPRLSDARQAPVARVADRTNSVRLDSDQALPPPPRLLFPLLPSMLLLLLYGTLLPHLRCSLRNAAYTII